MGQLSSEELVISPLSSIIIFIVVILCMEYGSRFFLRMQEPPSLDWGVLSIFKGDLFNAEARRLHLSNELGLGGVRALYTISSDSDPSLQSRAASAIASLLYLTVSGEPPPSEQVRSLCDLTRKFTPSARGHAALGIALNALDDKSCATLVDQGALTGLVGLACSATHDPELQGSVALALALIALQQEARGALLAGGGLQALYELLRSRNPDAVRCAACALAALAQHREAPVSVLRVFPPSVVVALCRSGDFFLQTVAAMLLRGLAADERFRLLLLHSRCMQPLLTIVHTSKSSAARFEAMAALAALSVRTAEGRRKEEREREVGAPHSCICTSCVLLPSAYAPCILHRAVIGRAHRCARC